MAHVSPSSPYTPPEQVEEYGYDDITGTGLRLQEIKWRAFIK